MFRGLAAGSKARNPEAMAGVFCLLYDAALVGARFDPGGLAPVRSRATARFPVSSTRVAAA